MEIRAARHSRSSGYTLMELLVTVSIIALVAAIAIPNYRNHVLKSQRSDAKAALLRVAAAQEKWYLQNNTYTTSLADLNVTETENELYTLSVGSADADGFEATATADGSKSQGSDKDCQTFSVNEAGTRTATAAGGGDNTEVCWGG